MKVLLVNPSIRPNSPKCLLNVGLAYIASAINRAGIDLKILDVDAHRYSDDEVARMIREEQFDVAAVGDLVSHYRWVKWLAATIKESHPNAPVIAGNTVATSIPKVLLEHTAVDIAVISEGDETVVDLLVALNDSTSLEMVPGIAFKQRGKIVQTMPRRVIEPIDAIPFPNYDLFDIDVYLQKSKWMVNGADVIGIPFDDIVVMPIVTARGCPFQCTFCYHAFQHKKYRYHSPEAIAGEAQRLKEKYGANFIMFWDELSFYDPDQARRVAELFIERELNIKWEGTCRSELIDAEHADLAALFKKSGCTGMGYALENGNDEILKAMNKKNTTRDFVFQAKTLREAGLPTFTSVVFGYPQETPATIRETFDVLREAQVYPSVGFLQPMPGTPMFELAVKNGQIPDVEAYLMRMGDRQDLRVNLTSMSNEEMSEVIEAELRKLNADLKIGLNEEELIKTRVYRVAKSEAFAHSFGIAARVQREDQGLIQIDTRH
jgi:anaerobic magnesium-protoporphyrin IX monomethyl ester cyclase